MKIMTQFIDKLHVKLKTKQNKQWFWFIGLWCAGIIVTLSASYGLKFILNAVY